MCGTLPGDGTPATCDKVSDKYAFTNPSDISDSDDDEPETSVTFKLTLHLHGKPIDLPFFSDDATIQDLSDTVAEDLHIPPQNQKFLITPKTGLLRPPFKDASLAVKPLLSKKIVLMGATTAEVEELESDISERKARMERRRAALQAGRRVKAHKSRDSKKAQDEAR